MSEDAKEKNGRLKELHETKNAVKEKMLTLIAAAFGLVAALAWNDAVQSLFKIIFSDDNRGIIGKFVYAVIITVIVAVISSRLGKITEKK